MSFLLGENRTATVKAVTDLKVIKIPKEKVSTFLNEFPEVVREFARYLAKRLDETSQIVYGLKEFCDQLPDAVILTDRDGKILSWNRAAEKLYGREEDQMRYKSAEEIYEDPAEYRRFLEEVISKYAVSEKTLRVRHPKEGVRLVSTSTTVLYDGQHNFQGVLSLGRDATRAETVARRYQRVRRWFIPLFVLLVLLGAGIFFGYPYFSKGYNITDAQKQDLKDDLAVNYRLLRSLLVKPFEAEDRQKTTDVMKGFFDVQKGVKTPFTGLVLLGKDKRVFDAYSILPDLDGNKMIGTSYSGIDLGEKEAAPYKVLTLYREHNDQPMGVRHTEIAFRLYENYDFIGWLVFQVDMDLLKSKYSAGEEDLKNLRFEGLKENRG
jgi:PAS domain S-box-containing protein